MERYEIAEAAERAGVSLDELRRLVDLGILKPDAENRLTSGDVRRVGMVGSLTAAGIPLDGLGAAIRSGQVSLDFLDEPAYERFSALSGVTFAELGERTGIPVPLLMLIPSTPRAWPGGSGSRSATSGPPATRSTSRWRASWKPRVG